MNPDPGERWNVNMPAVVGVVFVFLIGVIVWVIVSSGGGDGDTAVPDTSPTLVSTAAATTAPPVATDVPDATTPAPMPDLQATTAPTAPPTSPPPATAPPTNPPPPTTAPGAEPDAVLGDLAIPGRPMQAPPCNDSYITIVASAVGDQASAAGLANVLDTYPGSNYLRTDQTCPSLNPDVDGEPIYVVYFGPFVIASDACAARANGPDGAYARQLSNNLGPSHSVDCP
jgi:serine/threonine-protein kinase